MYHCAGGTPNHFWFPFVTSELQRIGYTVSVPQLPDADHPDIKKWLPYALEEGTFTTETVLIGHSAGCPLILSILETIEVKIRQALLVAGFIEEVDKDEPEPILQASYDWKKIKSHVGDIVFINSDNDPWGCDDTAGRKMFDQLGGTLIIRHGEGHMGSETLNQPYKEFPLIVKLVEAYQ